MRASRRRAEEREHREPRRGLCHSSGPLQALPSVQALQAGDEFLGKRFA